MNTITDNKPDRTALLVIDLQKEFKDKTGEKYNKLTDYITTNASRYDYLLGTLFKLFPDDVDYYREHLNWDGCQDVRVKDPVVFQCMELKSTYGISDGLIGFIKDLGVTNVDVIGVDTDACILATCFKLFDNRINFHVLTDLCYSTAEDEHLHEYAIDIMKRNFGDCVIS